LQEIAMPENEPIFLEDGHIVYLGSVPLTVRHNSEGKLELVITDPFAHEQAGTPLVDERGIGVSVPLTTNPDDPSQDEDWRDVYFAADQRAYCYKQQVSPGPDMIVFTMGRKTPDGTVRDLHDMLGDLFGE
jgi:hypothetical protein